MFARHFIDSLDFARKGKELRGEIPVAEMPRLQDVLTAPDGEVAYILRGFRDEGGNLMLELALNGLCQLRCQRCLQGMDYPIKQVSRLMLADEQPEDELSADDFDSIPPDAHLDVAALVEEEILLSLPFAPRHEPGVCQAEATGLQTGAKSPFAVLRSLKDK
jgi:DUF177 domain-containing protein